MYDNSENDLGLISERPLAEKQTFKYARDLALIYEEEKARRRDLEAAHEKMRAVVDSMTDGMLAVDNDFIIIEANRVAGQFLKTDPADLLGAGLFEKVDFPELEKWLFTLKESLSSKDSVEFEMSSPGRQVLRIDASKLSGDEGYVFVLQDITSQKRDATLKNDFLSILSHELRTPLNAILGCSELLSDDLALTFEEEHAEYLQMITESGNRMTDTVVELLKFVQFQSEERVSLDEQVFIDRVFEQLLPSLRAEGDQKGIELSFQSKIENPAVWGSETMLKDLFQHIIENAVAFGEQGGRVLVELEDRGEHYEISVADDGIGISEDQLEKVFESFYQVEKFMTRTHEGLGLGLTLAKHIAELHGGHIRLESEPGRGTTCFVGLPKDMGGKGATAKPKD